MMNQTYRALVFDMDGTAVDTTACIPALGSAYQRLRGVPLDPQKLQLCYGMTNEKCLHFLNITPQEREEFLSLFRQEVVPLLTQTQLFPGFYQMLTRVRDAGLLLGINTSRTREELFALAPQLPQDFFRQCACIVTCDRVASPKPAPDSLLLFCRETGCPAHTVLYVGDTLFDSRCAQDSGVDFALAAWGTSSREIPCRYAPATPQQLGDILLGVR